MAIEPAQVPDPLPRQADCDLCALSAFHDGELAPLDAAAIERHLAQCADCRDALAEIEELSALGRQIGAEGLSPARLRQIHRAIDDEPRINILRIGLLLSGLAASVMVIGSAWLWDLPDAPRLPPRQIVIVPGNAPQWENICVNLRYDPLPRTPWELGEQRMPAYAELADAMVQGLERSSQ